MLVGIATARAAEPDLTISVQPVLSGIQRMLPGEDQARSKRALRQGGGNGRKLDRFWTSSDNEVDTRTGQLSPWLGAVRMPA
jgi:hypothetical protein